MSIDSYSQITDYKVKVTSESGNQDIYKCMANLALHVGGISSGDGSGVFIIKHIFISALKAFRSPSDLFHIGQDTETKQSVNYHERYLQTFVDVLRNEARNIFLL